MKKIKILIIMTVLLFTAGNLFAKAFPYAGDMSAGINGADENWDSYIDFMIPLASKETSFVFLSPRASMTGESVFGSSSNEFNAGIGFRHYLDKFFKDGAIFGVNAYYDTRNTSMGNNFQQAGAGIEFLSKWIDARINAYVPFGNDEYYTGKTYNLPGAHHIAATYMYEVSMKGFDGEAGLRVPLPDILGDLRLFGGYYYFEAEKVANAQRGFKGRAEYRPLKILRFNYAVYENEEFSGSSWQAGAEISLPLDFVKLLQVKNPFAGVIKYVKARPKTVKERIGETVQRDMYVRTAAAGIKHNEDLLKNGSGDDYYFTVVKPDGTGNGTFENPANLSDGLTFNKAVAGTNAALLFLPGSYEADYAINLEGHLSARAELLSYGFLSGMNVELPSLNKNEKSEIRFSSDTSGVVLSQNTYLQKDIVISGLNFYAPAGSTKEGVCFDHVSGNIHIESNSFTGFKKGVFVSHSSAPLAIIRNDIDESITGIELLRVPVAVIYGNNVLTSSEEGFAAEFCGNLQITGNTFAFNKTGISVKNSSSSVIFGNIISSNTGNGIFVSSSSLIQVSSNNISFNSFNGIYMVNSATVTVGENILSGNGADGIHFFGLRDSVIYKNESSSNGASGIFLDSSSNTLISGNYCEYNILDGIRDIKSELNYFTENFMLYNCGNGLYVSRSTNAFIMNNQMNENLSDGAHLINNYNLNFNVNTSSANSRGIYLQGGSNYMISYNDIYDNAAGGMFISGSADGTVSNNNIISNAGTGIFVTGNAKSLEFSVNSVSNNSNGGIYAENSDEILIRGNFIEYNKGANGGIFIKNITNSSSTIDYNDLTGNEHFEIRSQSSSAMILDNTINLLGESHGLWLQDNVNTRFLANIIISEKRTDSYFALYLKGTTVFNVSESGNNKFFYTGANTYSGDSAAVQNYELNVKNKDEVIP